MPEQRPDHITAPREFDGRTALVTGASRGIAAAIARALAAKGARVAINYCADADAAIGRENAAAALAAEITADGGKAIAIEQNLMVPHTGTALAEKATKALGFVDTLVLSASVQYHTPFLEQSPFQVSEQLQLNLQANIALLQGLMPAMVANSDGRILTIGSIQEISPASEMPIYSMTKAAMKNLVENLAVQSAGHGVIINNIAPGLIATDRNAFRRTDEKEWQATQARANPVGRAGQPEDLTGLALHLLSPSNSFTTGATIYATGGAHIPNAGGLNPTTMTMPSDKTSLANDT